MFTYTCMRYCIYDKKKVGYSEIIYRMSRKYISFHKRARWELHVWESNGLELGDEGVSWETVGGRKLTLYGGRSKKGWEVGESTPVHPLIKL